MNKNNLRFLINNPPVQTVEFDNSWEETLKIEETKILNKFNLEKENICETELISKTNNSINHLAHQPIKQINSEIDPKTNQTIFWVYIELEEFNFTEASPFLAFFKSDLGKIVKIRKINEAQRLLNRLQTNSIKIVNNWGIETTSAIELKNDLIEGLKDYINQHKNNKVVMATFEE